MCGAYEAIAAALEPAEESIGWIVGPTYDLTDRIFRRVHLAVMQHLRHRVVEVNEKQRWFQIRNMSGGISEVRCKSADNPVSLLGEALDFVIVDEASRLPSDVWDGHLAQRLVDKQGHALLLSTPRGVDWFYRAFRRGQKGRDPMYESWSSPSWDNPHIPPEAIEAERSRLGKDAFDQEFGAKFIGAEDDPCEVCRGPSRDVPGITILQPGDELAKCSECEKPVDADGQTLVKRWADGSVHMKVFQCVPDTLRDVSLPSNVQAVPDSAPK
jgi:hypothetical protein